MCGRGCRQAGDGQFTRDVPPVARQQAWYRAAALIPLPACSSPLSARLQAFVPQMHPGMARDDACDRSPAAQANTPAGGKFTDSYM